MACDEIRLRPLAYYKQSGSSLSSLHLLSIAKQLMQEEGHCGQAERVLRGHLHGDEPVVDLHLFSEKICSDCGFVLAGEFLIDILIHEGGLSYTGVACRASHRPLRAEQIYTEKCITGHCDGLTPHLACSSVA